MFLAEAGVALNGVNGSDSIQGSLLRANLEREKEESDVEKAISEIVKVQVCHMLVSYHFVCLCFYVFV